MRGMVGWNPPKGLPQSNRADVGPLGTTKRARAERENWFSRSDLLSNILV